MKGIKKMENDPIQISLKMIEEGSLHYCEWIDIFNLKNKTVADDGLFDLSDNLNGVGFDVALWCFRFLKHKKYRRICQQYALWCVKRNINEDTDFEIIRALASIEKKHHGEYAAKTDRYPSERKLERAKFWIESDKKEKEALKEIDFFANLCIDYLAINRADLKTIAQEKELLATASFYEWAATHQALQLDPFDAAFFTSKTSVFTANFSKKRSFLKTKKKKGNHLVDVDWEELEATGKLAAKEERENQFEKLAQIMKHDKWVD